MKDGEGDKTRKDELWDPTWSDSQPPYDWTLTKEEKDELRPVGGHEEAEEETEKETDCEVDDETDGQDARREDFLRRVEDDPDLPISRDLAHRAYDFMLAKIDELGLKLLIPEEMAAQLRAGSRIDSTAEDLHEKTVEKEQEPKIAEENEGLEKDFKQEEEDQQFKDKVEEIHEDWDSSEASTKNKWSDQSDSPSLEQKLKQCPKEDHYRVALMHEINQEKKGRRDTKEDNKRKAGEQAEIPRGGWSFMVSHHEARFQ